MRRPHDLFDRDREWTDLAEFASRPTPGVQLALVRGRRRQGKSFLLRRLVHAFGGFYHQAVEEERAQALAGLGRALGTHLGVPGGRLAFADWQEAIDAMADVRSTTGPALIVLDEFPYLLTHSPELPSVLQRVIDRSRDDGPPVRIVLCGSALSVMADLLTGAQALRGRATLDLVLKPFDYRRSAEFWGIDDPRTAFTVHAVLGGTPGYRDLLPADPPAHATEVAPWLTAGPLNPASALFREDDYLLTEERTFNDRALYHSVVTAVADGRSSQGAIAAALGREQRAVQHPLRALEEAGFIIRTDDALRARRPIYALADPIIRFHHVITRRDIARFEDRRTMEAWVDAQQRFSTHVLGPHFEDLARTFTFAFASDDTVGGRPARVAPAVVNDATQRSRHEIDVVALGRDTNTGAHRVLALGEAKHTNAPRTLEDLERLVRIRTLVSARHPEAASARILIFSANGFDGHLIDAAMKRVDLELIDITRLYTGS